MILPSFNRHSFLATVAQRRCRGIAKRVLRSQQRGRQPPALPFRGPWADGRTGAPAAKRTGCPLLCRRPAPGCWGSLPRFSAVNAPAALSRYQQSRTGSVGCTSPLPRHSVDGEVQLERKERSGIPSPPIPFFFDTSSGADAGRSLHLGREERKCRRRAHHRHYHPRYVNGATGGRDGPPNTPRSPRCNPGRAGGCWRVVGR